MKPISQMTEEQYTEDPNEPFVFIDSMSRPFLLANGWIHYWNEANKNWVTLREHTAFDLGRFFLVRLPKHEAAIYGLPCQAD